MSTVFVRIRRAPGGRPLVAAVLASIGASAAACIGPAGWLPLAAPATIQQPHAELTPRQRRQLQVFGLTVLNPSPDIDAQTRRDAAEELIAMNVPAAVKILDEALRSGRPLVVLPVIDAMESSAQPVQGLLPAAVSILQDASGETLEKLSIVLPRYGQAALDLVTQLALDREPPPAKRTGPIHALGAFRNRDSAVRLMALLDEQHPAPPEIIAAACASLQRLTGLPYGSNAQQWRRWWRQHKDEPIEDWLRIMVQQLSTRIADLEQQIQQYKRANDDIAKRLADTLRQLFLAVGPDEQLQRLPDLLGDDLAPVREFAIGRVERLLRDSKRVPEPVQEKLAERLGDRAEVPALRLSSAQLLNDLNYPPTRELVAAALGDETDPQITTGYLEILAKRPTPAGLDPTLQRLNDPSTGEAAANTLWAMIAEGVIGDDRMPATRLAVRAAFERHSTPAHARLLAAIGEQQDLAGVEGLLDAADPALRRAVAEGLCFAGLRDPLLRRAADEEVYPFAVRLLARGPADLATLRSLAELAPPEMHRKEWSQAIAALAEGLTPADLLAADDLLASFEHVDLGIRADALARVADLPPEAMNPEQRSALSARLAELWISLSQYQHAYELLQRLDEAPVTPALTALRFRAAALAGHYEEAVALNDDVLTWAKLFAESVEHDPRTALALGDEIQQRFEDALAGEARVIFDAAYQRLPEQVLTNGTSGSEPPE